MIFLIFVLIDSKSEYFIFGVILFIVSAIIGLLAIKEHGEFNFNIRPDIKQNCKLITTGVYKYIRHPMYFSVIFGMFGIMIAFFSLRELILYIILIIVMITKLNYEESLWCNYTKEYIKYKNKTKKLIPFIY